MNWLRRAPEPADGYQAFAGWRTRLGGRRRVCERIGTVLRN